MEQYSEFRLATGEDCGAVFSILTNDRRGLWSSILKTQKNKGQEKTVEQYSQFRLTTGEDCGAVF